MALFHILCLSVFFQNECSSVSSGIWSLGWEDPLGEGMKTHSRILAWWISWTEEPREYSLGGCKELHDWARTEESSWLECWWRRESSGGLYAWLADLGIWYVYVYGNDQPSKLALTTFQWVNTHHPSATGFFFLLMRTFKIYSLSNFFLFFFKYYVYSSLCHTINPRCLSILLNF